ncbi:hypothetical protein ACFYO9_37465 [Streptomyces sp. NPDC005863]|uniref:hypothetical protein n=1 Tax=Streptomyces sp. NPDC005863 TaxID=3364735 RepID=UPI00367CF113
MTSPRPAAATAKPSRRPQARKYVNQAAGELLARCFPGLVPARVIEEALREKAQREGRLARRRT